MKQAARSGLPKGGALHAAISQSNYPLALQIVKDNPSLIDSVNLFNETPLNLAIRFSKTPLKIIDALSSKFSVTNLNQNGDDVLHTAILFGNYSFLPLLVQKGANIEITNFRNWTPLYHIFADAGSYYYKIPTQSEYTCLISKSTLNNYYHDHFYFQSNGYQAYTDRCTVLGNVIYAKLWDICRTLVIDYKANTNLLYRYKDLSTLSIETENIPLDLFKIIVTPNNIANNSCEIFNTSLRIRRFDITRFLLTNYPHIVVFSTSYAQNSPLHYLTNLEDACAQNIPKDIIFKLARYNSHHFIPHHFIPLKYLCALTIKITLHSRTNSAYASLGLPSQLTNFVKNMPFL